jgi:hypothetical protein
MTTTNTNIDYQYVQLNFDYTWLRDKQLILRGNSRAGMLIIIDADGRTVGMYAFEEII